MFLDGLFGVGSAVARGRHVQNIRAEEIDVKRLEIERSDYYESLDKEIEEAYTIAAEAKEGSGLF